MSDERRRIDRRLGLAAQLDPTDSDAWEGLADALDALGRDDEADTARAGSAELRDD